MCLGRGSGWLALGLACALVGVSVTGQAQQPHTESRAEKLFQSGKRLLEQKKIDAACQTLEESYRLETAVGTLGLLAACHDKQGRRALAWREYRQTAQLAHLAKQAQREKVALDLAAAIRTSLPTLTIRVQSPVAGLLVTLNTDPIPEAEWGEAIPVDPGTLQLKATAPGFVPWTKSVLCQDQGTEEVMVPPLAKETVSDPPKPIAITARATTRSKSSRSRIPGLIVTTLGVAGLGAGGYFGMVAIKKNDESKELCNSANECSAEGGKLRDEATRSATTSTISMSIGAAAVGVGIWMLVSAGSRPTAGTTGLWIAPEVTATNTGASLGGRF